jgi:hypothetical protein
VYVREFQGSSVFGGKMMAVDVKADGSGLAV